MFKMILVTQRGTGSNGIDSLGSNRENPLRHRIPVTLGFARHTKNMTTIGSFVVDQDAIRSIPPEISDLGNFQFMK
jgi:hypothetical protein